MNLRDSTKIVNIGGVRVGGGHPVVIQSMANTDTRNVQATVAQINELAAAGCEIIRVAVPDIEAAEAIAEIKKQITLPLVADIHFDHRLALASIKNGADKLRLNPGNIGAESNLLKVAQAAKAENIPIRVGVNGGSLEKEILTKYGGVTAEGLAESALLNVHKLEKSGFFNIVVSVKASNVPLMLDAHKILAQELQYPLHIGLTEAGTIFSGAIRSAAGLGALLHMGLGDTLRVSLSGGPIEEIRAAKEILSAMGLRKFGVKIIACPTCGRTNFDVSSLATALEKKLSHITSPLTIAVMGCEVNGPGEAREADIGIAAAKNGAVIFRKGEIVKRVKKEAAEESVMDEIQKILEDTVP